MTNSTPPRQISSYELMARKLLLPIFLVAAFMFCHYWMMQISWVLFSDVVSKFPLVPELIATTINIFLIWLFWLIIQKETLKSAGIVPRGVLKETVLGFALGILIAGSAVAGMALTNSYRVVGFNNASLDLLLYFAIYLLVGINEELIFRVFIFRTCEKRWGTVMALIATSAFFGLMHLGNQVPGASFSQKLCGCLYLISESGLVFNAAYLAKRRVWLPIGLHWAWNFFEGPIFGTYVSGTTSGAPILRTEIEGPFWATGGAFGPEASLAGVVTGTACGALLLWYAIKRGNWNQLPETQANPTSP